jgi:hypothetical protein
MTSSPIPVIGKNGKVGRNSEVMHEVEEALGRPATDFEAYVRKTIDTGVWAA